MQSFCALALFTCVTCTNHCTITLCLITWFLPTCVTVWCLVTWTPDAGDFVDGKFWWHWVRQTVIEIVPLLRTLAPHNKDSRTCAKRPCIRFHYFVLHQHFILVCWCIYVCVLFFLLALAHSHSQKTSPTPNCWCKALCWNCSCFMPVKHDLCIINGLFIKCL